MVGLFIAEHTKCNQDYKVQDNDREDKATSTYFDKKHNK